MIKKIIIIRAIFLTVLFNTCLISQEQNLGWAERLLSKLTLREKIGQLFVVAATSSSEILQEKLATGAWVNPYNLDQDYIKNLISDYKIGGLIYLYGNTPEKQLKSIRDYNSLSDIPLLITQDCEWGINMRHKEAINFPRNLTLGAIQDKNKIYELGKEIARQCKLVGVHMNFSPVIDCNNNKNNVVIHDRSFGDDPDLVAEYGTLMSNGLQDGGVLACAKHFPGHGDTSTDSHLDLPVINHDLNRLENLELVPFKKLIDSGVSSIMLAHMSVPELDNKNIVTFSHKIVTEFLEKKLKFAGLKITDALGMGALTNYYEPGEIELKAYLAGFDILLCPLDVPKSIDLIEQAILSGRASEADLDRRVMKILKIKELAIKPLDPSIHSTSPRLRRTLPGFVQDFAGRGGTSGDEISPEKLLQEINSDYAKNLKASLYQEAVTILKDTNNILPIHTELENFPDPKFWDVLHRDLVEELWVYEDCYVAAITNISKFADKNFNISAEIIENLKSLKSSSDKKLIVTLYGTPYCANLFDFADVIIVAYENDPDAKLAVEKILSGECKATGKLPVKI